MVMFAEKEIDRERIMDQSGVGWGGKSGALVGLKGTLMVE